MEFVRCLGWGIGCREVCVQKAQCKYTLQKNVPCLEWDWIPQSQCFERIADVAVECFDVLITGGNHSFRLYVPYFP